MKNENVCMTCIVEQGYFQIYDEPELQSTEKPFDLTNPKTALEIERRSVGKMIDNLPELQIADTIRITKSPHRCYAKTIAGSNWEIICSREINHDGNHQYLFKKEEFIDSLYWSD